MDSDSDWDSMTDGSVIDTKSVLKSNIAKNDAKDVSKQSKIKKTDTSPYKNSVNFNKKTDHAFHQSPKKSDYEPHPPKKDHQIKGVDNTGFKSMELLDRSHLESIRSKPSNKNRNKNNPKNDKIPFIDFKVDTPHRKVKETLQKSIGNKQKPVERADNYTNSWDKDEEEEAEDDDDEDEDTDVMIENNNEIYGESFADDNAPQEKFKSSPVKIQKQQSPAKLNQMFVTETRDNNTPRKYNKPPKSSFTEIPIDNREIIALEDESTVRELNSNVSKPLNENENENLMQIVEKRYYYEKSTHEYHRLTVPNSAIIPKFADRAESFIHRLWEELFGLLRIIISVFTIFILELVKFVLITILHKLVVELLTIFGDYFIKPFLSSLFNSIIQPVFIYLWNLFAGVRRLLSPVVLLIDDILKPIGSLVKSFRLVEWNTERQIKNV